MESKTLVERFCYLGGFKPVSVVRRQSIDETVENLCDYLNEIDGESFIAIVKKCLDSNSLPRKDELCYTVAAYLAYETTKESHETVRSSFSTLIKTSDDLFLFAKYAKMIRTKNIKIGFSKTTKKAITQWYKEQNSKNLIDMWATSIGKHGFTHSDLIAMCHINIEDLDNDKCLTTIINKPRKIIKHNNLMLDQNNSEISNDMKRILNISQFKTSGDMELAKRLIKENVLKFENVPNHLLNNIDIWKFLLPIMTGKQLLTKLHFLNERKMLNKIGFCKTYLKALGNVDIMHTENIHPNSYLLDINKVLNQKRYSETVKNHFYVKKISTSDLTPNTVLNNKLTNIFHRSFENVVGNGIRTFVTINLQNKTKKQCVINQKHINCYDAAVTLAYSYFKSEPSSVVYTYAKDTKLKKIDWNKNMNFIKANEQCSNNMIPKTVQKLVIPICEAVTHKEIYDLFLIIVPSGTYGNQHNKPNLLIQSLKTYREKKNNKARMVIVNLRRFNSAMIYDDDFKNNIDNNIIELCGLDESTPKLINAFALNYFN